MDPNSIGGRGEFFCAYILTTKVKGKTLFEPVFLGEKFEALDFFVRLKPEKGDTKIRFFVAQVKSTETNPSIFPSVPKFINIGVPCYYFGVDLAAEEIFIVSSK